MSRAPARSTPPSRRGALVLSPAWRDACTLLNVLPLPGLGALIAGWKNPHTRLRLYGSMQLTLVVFGSWPLLVPGAIGFLWAAWTAYTLHRDAVPPGPLSRPTRDAPPETLHVGFADRLRGRWEAWQEGRRRRRDARRTKRRDKRDESEGGRSGERDRRTGSPGGKAARRKVRWPGRRP